MIKNILTVATSAVLSFAMVAVVYPADADSTWDGSNGYKIHVSPAKHSPDNTGCNGHPESPWAQKAAHDAAVGAGHDLVARGYSVRLGSGSFWENKNSSNAWGAHYHIPMHSNAPGSSNGWDCTAPYNLSQGASGTLLMHYPGSVGGSGLSSKLVTTVGPASPGQGLDKKIASTCCAEITQTNAKCAYLESAFHTFGPDKDWLQQHADWAWRVGWGVDSYLDYP